MGHQFVMGRTIDEALERCAQGRERAYRYSFDMLGEAALTDADAERYLEAYREAIDAIGAAGPFAGRASPRRSISVKLSALHPRYESRQARTRAGRARARACSSWRSWREDGIGLTVDAEEADRLELSLDLTRPTLCW